MEASPEVDSGKALQHSLQGLRRVEGLQTVAKVRGVRMSTRGYVPRFRLQLGGR